MEFRLHVRGDRACFKRPEFVEDLVTYDVIPPRVARGIFEAVYAAPAARWRIDTIDVLRPIRFTWMSLADMAPGGGVAAPERIFAGRRDRRMAQVLSDVAYIVTAHIEPLPDMRESVAAHEAMFRRRAASGRFFRPPFLGLRGLPADVTAIGDDLVVPESAYAASGAIDLGWMIHDFEENGDARAARLRLYRPVMLDGTIDLRRRESLILAG